MHVVADFLRKRASGWCMEVDQAVVSKSRQTETSRASDTAGDKKIFYLPLFADILSPPVNVTITAVKANSAVVTWDIPEGDPVIGFAITQQVSRPRAARVVG